MGQRQGRAEKEMSGIQQPRGLGRENAMRRRLFARPLFSGDAGLLISRADEQIHSDAATARGFIPAFDPAT